MRLKYEPALDGLRAVSAVAVIMLHCHAPYFSGGGRGVDVFFVLSGYLITKILLGQDHIDLREFWSARIRRLLPAFLIVAIAVLAASPLYIGGFGVTPLETVYALTYTMNFAVAAGHKYNPLSHTWSLAQEMQFYLLWPFVLPLLSKFRRPRMLLLLGWLLVTGLRFSLQSDFRLAVFSPITHCSGLLLGALINFLPSLSNAFGLVGIVLIAISLISGSASWSATFGIMLAEIGAALLIANIVSMQSVWKNVLSFKPLVKLGVISYGLYLWHYPLADLVAPFPWQLKVPFVLPTAILLALLTYDLVETRFTRNKVRRTTMMEIEA